MISATPIRSGRVLNGYNHFLAKHRQGVRKRRQFGRMVGVKDALGLRDRLPKSSGEFRLANTCGLEGLDNSDFQGVGRLDRDIHQLAALCLGHGQLFAIRKISAKGHAESLGSVTTCFCVISAVRDGVRYVRKSHQHTTISINREIGGEDVLHKVLPFFSLVSGWVKYRDGLDPQLLLHEAYVCRCQFTGFNRRSTVSELHSVVGTFSLALRDFEIDVTVSGQLTKLPEQSLSGHESPPIHVYRLTHFCVERKENRYKNVSIHGAAE